VLLRTMFLLAFLAVLGETIVHGAASLAQAALRARALDLAHTAFVSGVRAAQASIAQGVAPAPIATCAFADANGCEINVQTTIATATPSAAPAASACPGTPCTVILQGNSAVSEARTTFLISTVVNAASGATLATRSGTVAFRTFATPPHAAIIGGADGTLSALLDGGAADDAGAPTTLITVEYDPNSGGTNTDGNVWQPVIEDPASAAPAWEP
jgi:hypothetical protein